MNDLTLAQRRAQAILTDRRAQTFRANGDFALAEQDHRYVIELAQTLNEPTVLAAALYSAALTLNRAGKNQASVGTLETALRALSDENPALASVLNQLQMVSKGFNPPVTMSRALDLDFKADYTLEQLANDPFLPVLILTATGDAYLRMGQYRVALSRYQEAEPFAKENRQWLGHIAANRAMALRAEGNRTEALQSAQRAVELLKVGKDLTGARWPLGVQAGLLRDQGNYPQAAKLFRQVIKLYEKAEDTLGAARMTSNLGLVYLLQEEWSKAEKLYRPLLPVVRRLHDQENLWHILWGYGRALFHTGKLAEAEEILAESVTEIERQAGELRTDEGTVTFLESRQDVFDALLTVQVARAQQNEPDKWSDALATAERARGRALATLLGDRARRRPLAPWLPQTSPPEPTPTEATTDEAHAVSQIAQSNIPIFAQMATPSSQWEDEIAQKLSEGTWRTPQHTEETPRIEAPPLPRLVYHTLPTQTVLFYVDTNDTVSGFITPHGRAELQEVVRAARYELGAYGLRGARLAFVAEVEEPPELENPLPTLYEWLIEPISHKLPETLVIEPHGSLWQVPFAALGPAESPLATKCALLLTPSENVLRDIRTSKDYGTAQSLPVLLVGNPTMPLSDDFSFDPLPGAEAEVLALKTLFGERTPTLFQHATATKAAVQIELGKHGILHLATHGYADTRNPLASFLVLAPEGNDHQSAFLYARDVVNLSLPADLVVLSACQTGLGLVSGDGVIGLSRALLIAGARTVLVSLWNVDDAATADFMRHFYEHYLATDNKAAALRHAMTTFLQNPATADPRLWAAFYLIGAEH
jgi:CHAT domain-containing protein/tetratricopeptide (TPR) repeat protein